MNEAHYRNTHKDEYEENDKRLCRMDAGIQMYIHTYRLMWKLHVGQFYNNQH